MSLDSVGKMIKRINLNTCPADERPQVMSSAEFDVFLDLCAAGMDVKHAPTDGPAQSRLQWELRERPFFKAGRNAMARLMAVSARVLPHC